MTLIKRLPAVEQISASARIKMFGVIADILIAVLKKVRYALCTMPYALCPVVPHLSEKGYTYIAPNELFKSYVPIHLSAIWDDSQAKR